MFRRRDATERSLPSFLLSFLRARRLENSFTAAVKQGRLRGTRSERRRRIRAEWRSDENASRDQRGRSLWWNIWPGGSVLEFDLGRGLKTRQEHLPEKGENRHFPSTVATHAKIWSVRGRAAKRGGRENSTQGREERERETERSAACRLVSARDLWLFALPQSPAPNRGTRERAWMKGSVSRG